jgi:DNA polymerase-3 subunit delta'
LLFHGPDGVGKKQAALTFAAALLCERSGADACGVCMSCVKIAREAHPDLLWVTRLEKGAKAAAGEEPEAAGEVKREIGVEQIRDLNAHAVYGPREGRFRVFAVEPADRMTVSAQNALLKTLEEPASRTVIVLLSPRPHALLPTVRSRCFAIRFTTMPTLDLARELEGSGMQREEALTRAALAEGRLRKARELDLEASRSRREEILTMLETASTGDPRHLSQLPAMASDLAGSDEASLLEDLETLGSLLRDIMRNGAGLDAASLVHTDLHQRLAALSARVPSTRAAELVRMLDRLRDELRFNLNRTLIAESLLASVAGAP